MKDDFFGGREMKLGDVLGRVYRNLGLEEKMSYAKMEAEWPSIVGDVIAQHSRPVEVVRKCLVVEVDSPVWLNELSTYSRADIMKRVQGRHAAIKDIRFKIGVFEEKI